MLKTQELVSFLKKTSDLDDFYNKIKKKSANYKGYAFELLTKYIFLYHPQYRNQIEFAYLYDEVPQKIIKKYNLPTKDKGIDLIAVTKDNEYYAIQCKYKSTRNSATSWSELSTFCGMLNNVKGCFEKGILVTNSYNLNVETKRAITNGKLICIDGNFFDSMSGSILKHITNCIVNKKVVPYSFEPREYQNNIVQKTTNYFSKKDRGCIIMACGTGKTITSAFIDKQMNNTTTLILVPSLYLLSQLYREWSNFYTSNIIRFLLIGSDSDVEKDDKNIVHGLITTTNEDKIASKIRYYKTYNKKIIVISTYQSAERLKNTDITFDICFFDEAHRTAGCRKNIFTALLTDDIVTINKRLFMTATPKIYNNIGEKIENTYTMDNKAIYGNEIATYSIRQGINDGYLSDYEIVVLNITDKTIADYIKRNNLTDYADSHHLACALAIDKAFKELKCTHMLTYHNRIPNSKKFVKLLDNISTCDKYVAHIDGKIPQNTRKKIINDFISEKQAILTSSKILNEGVNIPIVDSECFVEPRKSTFDIVQCIGRALRIHKGKKIARIIVPILFDENNKDRCNTDTSFSNMLYIIKSISEHDENIGEYFSARMNNKPIDKRIIRYIKYNDKGPMEDILTDVNLDQWIKSIELDIFLKADQWEFKYQKLEKFIKDNKSYPCQSKSDKNQNTIANWCNKQKADKKKGSLSNYQIKKLNNLPDWTWDKDGTFMVNYNRVVNYVKKYNKLPSHGNKNNDIQKIGKWCSMRRNEYKQNKLTDERIDMLENIDGWYWDKYTDMFNNNYTDLKNFVEINNRLPQANSKDDKEKSLYIWINKNRSKYKNKKLTQNQFNMLINLGINFSNTRRAKKCSWDERYSKYLNFCKTNNRHPKINIDSESVLYNWSNQQKSKYKNKKLSENEIEKLNNIDGWFFERDPFTKNAKELMKFAQKHKRMPVIKDNFDNGKSLSYFAQDRRKDYKNKKLSKERIDKLESIPFWYWNKKEKEVQDDIMNINDFVEVYHRFPKFNVELKRERCLYILLTALRTMYAKGELDKIYINVAESIKGWTW